MIDAYLYVAASALAANTVVRSSFGAAFPLFANQMYDAMNPRWASTLVGCVALLMIPIPLVLRRRAFDPFQIASAITYLSSQVWRNASKTFQTCPNANTEGIVRRICMRTSVAWCRIQLLLHRLGAVANCYHVSYEQHQFRNAWNYRVDPLS